MNTESIYTLGLSVKEENIINATYANDEKVFQNLLKDLQGTSINLLKVKDTRGYTCKFH